MAPNGRDDWSGRLPAPDKSGADGPFATLRAAQLAMRATAGARVTLVRGGSYFLDATLVLDVSDEGERFEAFEGERPVVYGGRPLAPWRVLGRDASAPVAAPEAGLPTLLDANGSLPISRLPPTGEGEGHEAAWLFADATPEGVDPHNAFRVRAGDGAVFQALGPGARIIVFGRRGWQNSVLAVRQTDPGRRLVMLDGQSWDEIGEGSRYAVLNGASMPGTWRWDAAAGVVRWQTDGSGPGFAHAVAATLSCVIAITGGRNIVVDGLHVVGSASEGAGLCLSDTRQITLVHLGITHTGDGIRLDHADETRIGDSEISRTGGYGIVLRHGTTGTVVVGNWLHDIGLLHQDASAIWFDASSRNRFAENRIENVGKFAIGGGSLTDGGAYDNVIEGNEIDRANQRTSDGGAILVIGWAQDVTRDVVRGNFISRTSAFGNIGWDGKPHLTFQDPVTRLVSEAIYLDDWASGVLVADNLLCGNVGGIDLHAGWDNRVEGNVLIDNGGIALAIDAEVWLGRGSHPHAMEGNIVERNTVVLRRPSTGQSGATAVRGDDRTARFDHNVYAGPGVDGSSFHHDPDHPWSAYSFGGAAWRRRGQDANSTMSAALPRIVVQGGTVRIEGAGITVGPLTVRGVGRARDRVGLADRIRQRCG